MIGVVYIESENTDGDCHIAETIAVEGLPIGTDVMELVRQRTDAALTGAGIYRAKAIHDDGWRRLRIYATRVSA